MSRPLDVQRVEDLIRDAETYWSAYRQQAEEDFSLYVDGPGVVITSASDEPIDTTNPPTAKAKVDAAANHLIAYFPSISIDKSAFPESEHETADTLEQALQAIFWRATSGEDDDPHRNSLLNAASCGMGCIHVQVDFSTRPEEGDGLGEGKEAERDLRWRRKNWFPITIVSVDPLEVLPDPGTRGRRWVARKAKMTVAEVKEAYGGWEPRDAAGTPLYTDFDEVERREWWSDDWYYVAVEDQPVQLADVLDPENAGLERDAMPRSAGPWRNPLGFIPYTVFASGYGAGRGKPEHRYQGLLTAGRKGGLFRAEARRMTQLDAMIDRMAWGALVGPPVVGGELDLTPGAYNEVQPDAQGNLPQISTLGGMSPPAGIFAEIARIRDAIDEATVPGILTSGESGSAESALKFVRKTQQALVGLNPLKRSAERAWVRVFVSLVKFFDNPLYFGPGETVHIWGQTPTGPVAAEIGPRLIRGRHVPVFVEIRPALPEDETLRIQTGLAGVGRAFSHQDFFDKFARWDNPAAAEKRLYKDLVKQQVIQSGVVAAYVSAVMTGQANPMMGLKGFIAAQQQKALAAESPQGAAEPTTDTTQPRPSPAQSPAAANNPAELDVGGLLQRALVARQGARPSV